MESPEQLATETSRVVYVSRTLRLSLLDDRDARVGTLTDVIAGTPNRLRAPPFLGFVATVAKRRVFVPASHVARVSAVGAQLAEMAIDVRPYVPRPGEIALAPLIGKRVGADEVVDIGLSDAALPVAHWAVSVVGLAPHAALRRRAALRIVDWREAEQLFAGSALDRDVARIRDLDARDAAQIVRTMAPGRRQQVIEVLSDDELADLVDLLPDLEQAAFADDLDPARLASVVTEMEPDEAVDLLGGVDAERRERVLDTMAPSAAAELRRLLVYAPDTAGGLMKPDPIVLGPSTSTAEALVYMRSRGDSLALATYVFVSDPPTRPPTGRYLGAVSFRRLLRAAPRVPLTRLLESGPEPVVPELGRMELASHCAARGLLVVPVCDPEQRLLGVVTADDVLASVLPDDRSNA